MIVTWIKKIKFFYNKLLFIDKFNDIYDVFLLGSDLNSSGKMKKVSQNEFDTARNQVRNLERENLMLREKNYELNQINQQFRLELETALKKIKEYEETKQKKKIDWFEMDDSTCYGSIHH